MRQAMDETVVQHRASLHKRGLTVALVALALMAATIIPPSTAGADADTVRPLNADRAEAGMSALLESTALDGLARRHSEEMAAANRLYHTGDLASAVTEV